VWAYQWWVEWVPEFRHDPSVPVWVEPSDEELDPESEMVLDEESDLVSDEVSVPVWVERSDSSWESSSEDASVALWVPVRAPVREPVRVVGTVRASLNNWHEFGHD